MVDTTAVLDVVTKRKILPFRELNPDHLAHSPVTIPVFPNQGSAEHRQGFREKSWNK
jgi:hypothetical protein